MKGNICFEEFIFTKGIAYLIYMVASICESSKWNRNGLLLRLEKKENVTWACSPCHETVDYETLYFHSKQNSNIASCLFKPAMYFCLWTKNSAVLLPCGDSITQAENMSGIEKLAWETTMSETFNYYIRCIGCTFGDWYTGLVHF